METVHESGVILFVDGSVWYAAADSADCGNARAKEILSGGDELLTTGQVLLETGALLYDRLGEGAVGSFRRAIRRVAWVESVRPADFEVASAIGKSFTERRLSFTNRTSFALMLRLGVHRVASFDEDFAAFHFRRKGKRRIFEVLR